MRREADDVIAPVGPHRGVDPLRQMQGNSVQIGPGEMGESERSVWGQQVRAGGHGESIAERPPAVRQASPVSLKALRLQPERSATGEANQRRTETVYSFGWRLPFKCLEFLTIPRRIPTVVINPSPRMGRKSDWRPSSSNWNC